MTSEGLGEMFEGDCADTRAKNFRSRRWGPSGGSRVCRPGSEDPTGESGNLDLGINTIAIRREEGISITSVQARTNLCQAHILITNWIWLVELTFAL